MKSAVMDVVNLNFRPEFINRVDEAIVFHPLKKDEIKKISQIQVKLLADRLDEQDISLDIEDSVYEKISDLGFDPTYGARPLKRSIQNLIENPLAKKILNGDFTAGSSISCTIKDGQIVFN